MTRRNSARNSSSPSGSTLRKIRRSPLRTVRSYSRFSVAASSPGCLPKKRLTDSTAAERSRTAFGSVLRWVMDGVPSPSRSRQ